MMTTRPNIHTHEANGVRRTRLKEWLRDTKNLQMRPAEMSVRRGEQLRDYLRAESKSQHAVSRA